MMSHRLARSAVLVASPLQAQAQRSGAAAASSAARQLSSTPYSERQAKLGRPLSPHVTIYKFPIAAVTSILNRGTGIALSVGATGIGAYSIVGGDAAAVFSCIGSTFLLAPVAKLAVSFPLVYHYLGGLRHFYWDANPETLNNEEVDQTSYLLLGASAALTIVAAAL